MLPSDSHLDVRYCLDSRMVCSIKTVDMMTVSGVGTSFDLPVALFQVLVLFAEGSTARQVFQMLDGDVDINEFSELIADLFTRGLLKRASLEPDDGPSLHQLLNPEIFSDTALVARIMEWMRDGRAIVVPDALPADFAEEVHRDLSQSDRWSASEGSHDFFHYRNCVLGRIEDQTPALTKCHRLFTCRATQSFIAGLSGQDCSGSAYVSAAWYRSGDYALPHDDITTDDRRSVAYIWYLAKDWTPQWGGQLFWCSTGQYVMPTFNSLIMFRVMPANLHSVCPVAPGAVGKRLTINGFWHRTGTASIRVPSSTGTIVSTRLYGLPVENCDSLPFIVL